MALPTNYLDYQKRVTSKIQNAPKYTYKPSRGKSTLPMLNLPVAKTTGQKAGEATKNFFRDALDTVGGIGKTVTHQLSNWTDGKATLGDIPLYDQLNMAKRSIGDEFNKGGLHSINAFLSAVPLGLQGIGREGKGFSETLKNAGVTNKNALMWGGLAGDIVLDPLNLVTGGGAAAAKAGLKATTGLNKVLAAEHGIQAGKNVYRTLDDLVTAGKVERGTKAFDDIEQRIASLANPARKQMDDSLFAINVPFTNMVKGVGTKPSWMIRNSEKIGSENANVIHNILREIGKDEKWLKTKYGVESIGDLDRQQLKHLQDTVDVSSTSIPKKKMVFEKENGVLSPKLVDDGFKTTFDAESLGRKFYRDAGGTSKLGNKIRKNIPILDKFNARVLQSDNVLASKSGDYIQDGYTKQAGMRHVIQKHYEKLNKMGKGLNDNELKTVAYILENKFPKGYDLAKWSSKHGIGREKMQQINAMVKYLKPALTHMAENEKKVGVLDNTIENYFPHMLKKGKEEEYLAFIEKYKNDPDIQGIFGKSSKLGNNQERKGFKTLAELDEKLYSMQKSLAKESDPAKIEELTDKINGLSNLFERNPVDAFAQRYYAGVKASAMKGIQDNLKKDGLFYTLGGKITSKDRITEGLTEIKPDDAKSFGLDPEKKHYMHPDVLKAFKEAEQLFTDEGMNKVVQNLVSATNVWRQFVTTYVPVHYVNNFIGNVANNTLAGIKPQSYVSARNLMRKMSNGSLTKAEQRIMDEAAERGVMNGFQADFLPRPDSDNIIDKIGNRVSNWAYPRFNSKVGERIDDVTRLAHFVEVYNKTGSFEKAGESVRKYLFNYNEITKADRLTKIAFPFWNWMKRNIPLQLKGLMSNPKYAANYNKIIQDLQGEDAENLPSWLQDTGLRIGANSYIDPRLPLQDLQNLGNLTPMDAMKYFGGSLNPLAKVPLEYWANKQFFNNRPIDYNYNQNGEYDPKELGAYLMNQTGIFGKLSKPMFDENVTVADSLRSLFLPKTYSPQ